MRVASYLRVSTAEQSQSGLSLTYQREKTKALADLHDWILVAEIEDAGVSAGSLNREGLQELLSLIRRREVDAIALLKLDRLTRCMKDLIHLLEQFQRYGVRLVSVCENLDTGSANGRFFIGMLGLIAEWERGIISERTKSANDQLRKEGKRFSGVPPFGWRYSEEGRMVEVPGEQETLRIMQKLSEEGLSLNGIGTKLLELERKPRSAKKWHPKVVASLLRAGSNG